MSMSKSDQTLNNALHKRNSILRKKKNENSKPKPKSKTVWTPVKGQ